MNALDKVICAIAPRTGLKREAARRALNVMNSGYGEYGASERKKAMRGFFAEGGSAKEDIDKNVDILRRRSRELYSGGSSIATGAIKTMRTNVIGRGLVLNPKIDAAKLGISEEKASEIETKIAREFALWAETTACDIERKNTFSELQQLAFINWLLSGDLLVLFRTTERPKMPYDLRIQLVEADRISTPDDKAFEKNITEGIETNENGEVKAYWVRNNHPYSDNEDETKWVKIEAYGKTTGRPNALHIMNDERVGQKRGLPFLSPVIADLKQIGRYTDAELDAAVIAAYFTTFIEKEENRGEPFPPGEAIHEAAKIEPEDDTTIELGPGLIYDLAAGEHVKTVQPGRPNTAFGEFTNQMAKHIGAALEMPPEVLFKSFTASYSASKGALSEAWKMFRMYRQWLINDFCQPIYEEWLCEAVSKGRIAAPGFFQDEAIRKAYSGAEWNGPAQGMLDPVKEANAATIRIKSGISTREREAMEINGSSFKENVKKLESENKALYKAFEFMEGDD